MMIALGCGDFIEREYTLRDVVISYVVPDGAMCDDCEDDNVSFGETVLLPAPAFRGYKFVGWYSTLSGEGELYGLSNAKYEAGTKDVTMYARWESYLKMDAGDSIINGIVCVKVESGTFTMGSPISEAGRYYDETQRQVTLTKAFWIGKYPVTNRQFAELYPAKVFPAGLEDHPVVNVDWDEASAFAGASGGFLPTEAQWEFAARGGNAGKSIYRVYSGGFAADSNAVAWHAGNSGGKSHIVGLKQPNVMGIYDMSGNVFEWCSDRYGYHDDLPVTDPEGPAADAGINGRIHRGGGFQSPTRECRVADRAFSHPSAKRNDIGFRVAFWVE